jgi:phage terminase small subunit
MDATPVSGKPVKPTTLDDVGNELWDRITAEHEARGTLGTIDTAALQSLCECWSLYRKALEQAKADPCDKDARCSTLAYLAIVDRLGSKYGWSPSDRAGLKMGGTNDKPTGVSAFARKRG